MAIPFTTAAGSGMTGREVLIMSGETGGEFRHLEMDDLASSPDPADYLRGDGSWVAFVDTVAINDLKTADADYNMAGFQLVGLALENRTSDPGSPTTGQIWLRTDL